MCGHFKVIQPCILSLMVAHFYCKLCFHSLPQLCWPTWLQHWSAHSNVPGSVHKLPDNFNKKNTGFFLYDYYLCTRRSMALNSRAVVGVAMSKGDRVIHHTWGSVVTHKHPRIVISVSGLNVSTVQLLWTGSSKKVRSV